MLKLLICPKSHPSCLQQADVMKVKLLVILGEGLCPDNNACSGNGDCVSPVGADEFHCLCNVGFAGNICQCKYFLSIFFTAHMNPKSFRSPHNECKNGNLDISPWCAMRDSSLSLFLSKIHQMLKYLVHLITSYLTLFWIQLL